MWKGAVGSSDVPCPHRSAHVEDGHGRDRCTGRQNGQFALRLGNVGRRWRWYWREAKQGTRIPSGYGATSTQVAVPIRSSAPSWICRSTWLPMVEKALQGFGASIVIKGGVTIGAEFAYRWRDCFSQGRGRNNAKSALAPTIASALPGIGHALLGATYDRRNSSHGGVQTTPIHTRIRLSWSSPYSTLPWSPACSR